MNSLVGSNKIEIHSRGRNSSPMMWTGCNRVVCSIVDWQRICNRVSILQAFAQRSSLFCDGRVLLAEHAEHGKGHLSGFRISEVSGLAHTTLDSNRMNTPRAPCCGGPWFHQSMATLNSLVGQAGCGEVPDGYYFWNTGNPAIHLLAFVVQIFSRKLMIPKNASRILLSTATQSDTQNFSIFLILCCSLEEFPQ